MAGDGRRVAIGTARAVRWQDRADCTHGLPIGSSNRVLVSRGGRRTQGTAQSLQKAQGSCLGGVRVEPRVLFERLMLTASVRLSVEHRGRGRVITEE